MLLTLIGASVAVFVVAGALWQTQQFERIARGDVRAMKDFFDQTAPSAMAQALRLMGDRAEAEDVVQESYVLLWRRAADYNAQRGTPAAWLTTIVRSRAIDRLRMRRTAKNAAEILARAPAPVGSALESVEQRQRRERVRAAVGALPDPQRCAIELAFYEGLTQAEIAARLSEPLGTVKTRLRLGLRKLHGLLGGAES